MSADDIIIRFDREYIESYMERQIEALNDDISDDIEVEAERAKQVVYDAYRSALETGHCDFEIRTLGGETD